ncbi:MAG: hypothetical protein V4695_11010 [Pseudomonadota bacterium]
MIIHSYQRLPIFNVVKVALVMLLSGLSVAGTAIAQTAPPVPSDAPPRLERLEEGAPAGTPQAPSPQNGVTESRDNSGAVNEIEVRTGISTYYLRPNGQVGNAQPGDQQSSGNRAAQFRVKEFDLGRKKVDKPNDAAQAADE